MAEIRSGAASCLRVFMIAAAVLVASPLPAAPPTSNVNVVNEPTVRVVNQPEVRDADHPARQAFQISLCTGGWPPGCGSTPDQFTVPADKRLVIEYVSAHCNANHFSDTLSSISVQTIVDGVPAFHSLVPVFMGNSASFRHYVAAQQMRVYADPGTAVTGVAGGFPAAGRMGCLMGLSGTLVDL